MTLTFDEAKHEYRLSGQVIPSVTQVISDTVGHGWDAGQWYMDRGKQVHAAAALIAQGKSFKCDPRIDGYVEAIRKLFREHEIEVLGVEEKMCSKLYRYAGTLDLRCKFDGVRVIADYKNSLDEERCKLQLGGYCALRKSNPTHGIAVELHEDGTYKLGCDNGKPWSLARPRQEFLALLTTYNIRRRLKVKEERDAND